MRTTWRDRGEPERRRERGRRSQRQRARSGAGKTKRRARMSLTSREFDFSLLPGGLSTARAKKAAAKRSAVRERAGAEQAATREQFTKARLKGRNVKDLILDAFESRHDGGSVFSLQRLMTKYHPSARVGVDDFVGLLKRVGMGDFPRSELEILFETYKEDARDETIELNRFVQDLGQMLRGRVTEETTLKLSTSSSALGAKQRTLHNIAEVERSREAADVTEEEAEELFFEKLAQRLPQGALALERAFRKAAAVNEESMDAQVSYEDFCRVIQRLGLEGLSNRVTQELFARYRPSGQEVSYEELVRKMASRYAQTRQSGGGAGGLAQQMQLSRKALQAHKEAAAKHAPAQGARHVNVAKLLLEKVEQRIHGEHQLRRCFRRTELDSDWSKLSFVEFQHGLIALGVTGVPDVAALAYFKEFDPEGTGYLDFRKLARALMPGVPPRPRTSVARDEQDGEADNDVHRHCRHRRHRRHRRHQGRRQRSERGEHEVVGTGDVGVPASARSSSRSRSSRLYESSRESSREAAGTSHHSFHKSERSMMSGRSDHTASASALESLRAQDLRLESVPEPRVAQHYQH